MMVKKWILQLVFAILLTGLGLPVSSGMAHFQNETSKDGLILESAPWQPPAGFETLLSQPGVTLYRKNYPNGTPDFVQVIQLDQGAALQLLHGILDEPRPGKGVFGGYDARFNLQSLEGFWSQARQTGDTAFCVTNGSFFYMPETPTRLPFSLKVDGVILTDGYGEKQYPDQTLMLEIWTDRVDIRPLNAENFNQSTAPNILGGLTPQANKRAKYAVGRTFVGVQDRDRDGKMETIYLLSTQTHTQSGAEQVLREFGAEKVMMLDGGGSAQLACQGKEYIATGRLIPQAIAIFSGDPGGLAAELLEAPDRISSQPGVEINQEWMVENTGELPWLPGEHRLVLQAGPYWEEQHFSPEQTVEPGQQLQFTWILPPFNQAGSYALSLRWYLVGAGRRSEIQQLDQELVVWGMNQLAQTSGALPANSWGQVEAGSTQDELFQSNHPSILQSGIVNSPEKISLRDVLMVPALILPLGFLLFWFFTWLRGYTA